MPAGVCAVVISFAREVLVVLQRDLDAPARTPVLRLARETLARRAPVALVTSRALQRASHAHKSKVIAANAAAREGTMAGKKSGSSGRNERSARTGEYVKKGTEKRRPSTTVTEPRGKKKR